MCDENNVLRLDVRLSAEVHALLEEATRLQGGTLSDFIIASARAAAEAAIAHNNEIRLTSADQQRFAEALLNPPPLAPALHRAMEHHQRLLDLP